MNKYNKHNEAINYALDKIKKSSLSEYIQEVILFDSGWCYGKSICKDEI